MHSTKGEEAQIFGLFKHTYFMIIPLEQKFIKHRLMYCEMMGVKMFSAVDPQMLYNNTGKQFSTCKYKKNMEGNF